MSSGKFSSREGRVLRLTKPRLKGILRIIFSRITFIAFMIILQVVILVMLYLIFEEYVANINAIMVVFSVLMVIYLYNSNMDSTSKLTWMMLIGLFPVPGALFLGFTRLDFGSRSLKRSLIAVKEKTSDRILQTIRHTVHLCSFFTAGSEAWRCSADLRSSLTSRISSRPGCPKGAGAFMCSTIWEYQQLRSF